MNRRGFLQSILAVGVAPAFIGTGVLMPVRKVILPDDGERWFIGRCGAPERVGVVGDFPQVIYLDYYGNVIREPDIHWLQIAALRRWNDKHGQPYARLISYTEFLRE